MPTPPDLSILICSVAERHDNVALAIQRQIYDQRNQLDDPARVEVIVVTDTRAMTIGAKRNHLIGMAAGRYVVFIDDDDEVTDDYVASLLDATASGADVLTFSLEYRFNGQFERIVEQSLRYTGDDRGRDTPRHTSAVRRDIAVALPFMESSYGEDADWARRLLEVAKTEHVIDRALYIYLDTPATSIARQYATKGSFAHHQWEQAVLQNATVGIKNESR